MRAGEAEFLNGTHFITGVDPGASKVFELDWVQGSDQVMDSLGEDGAFTDELRRGSQPSGRIARRGAVSGRRHENVPIKDLRSSYRRLAVRRHHDVERHVRRVVPAAEEPLRVRDHEGGETPENTAALDAALTGFLNAKLYDQEEFKDNQFSGVSRVLNVLTSCSRCP